MQEPVDDVGNDLDLILVINIAVSVALVGSGTFFQKTSQYEKIPGAEKAPGKILRKTEKSEPRKENPHFGFHEKSPVWVKSGSNAVLGMFLTQIAGGFIWAGLIAYSIKKPYMQT